LSAEANAASAVVYKLKNTSPALFSVKPIQGLLRRNETATIDVAFDKMAV
jgi:hypothetical protein